MTGKIWGFFDFDNTLMGTEALSIPSLIARFNELYADKIGHDVTVEEFFAHFQGMARESLCQKMSEHYKIHVDYPILFANRDWNMAQYFQRHRVPMAPNLIETLGILKQNGMRFAVVSNNTITRYLSSMRFASNGRGEELAAFFGTHFYEAQENYKPDPTVYVRAIAQTGADIKQSFAVEDSLTGAGSSLAAGLKTFGFVGYAEHPETREKELLNLGCVACFKDWADLPSLLHSHADR